MIPGRSQWRLGRKLERFGPKPGRFDPKSEPLVHLVAAIGEAASGLPVPVVRQ